MLIANILLFMDFPPLITAVLSAPSEVEPKRHSLRGSEGCCNDGHWEANGGDRLKKATVWEAKTERLST